MHPAHLLAIKQQVLRSDLEEAPRSRTHAAHRRPRKDAGSAGADERLTRRTLYSVRTHHRTSAAAPRSRTEGALHASTAKSRCWRWRPPTASATRRAREQGYIEREVLIVEPGFDWSQLRMSGSSLSLFGSRRLLELRIPSGKPGNEGAEAIKRYSARSAARYRHARVACPSSTGRARERLVRGAGCGRRGGRGQRRAARAAALDGWRGRLAQQGQHADETTLAGAGGHGRGQLARRHQEVQKLALLFPPGAIVTRGRGKVRGARCGALRRVQARRSLARRGSRARAAHAAGAGGRRRGAAAGAVGHQRRNCGRSRACWRKRSRAGRLPARFARGQGVGRARRAARRARCAASASRAGRWPRCTRRRSTASIKGLTPGDAWHELLRLALRSRAAKAAAGNRGHESPFDPSRLPHASVCNGHPIVYARCRHARRAWPRARWRKPAREPRTKRWWPWRRRSERDDKRLLEANARRRSAARAKGLEPAMIDRLTLTREQRGVAWRKAFARSRNCAIRVGEITDLRLPPDRHPGRPHAGAARRGRPSSMRLGPTSPLMRPDYVSRRATPRSCAAGPRRSAPTRPSPRACARAWRAPGLPQDAVQVVETTDRAAVGELITMKDYVDIIVPRGGKGLIERISNEARIPVLKHLDGVCHVYIDERADLERPSASRTTPRRSATGPATPWKRCSCISAIAMQVLPPLAGSTWTRA